jgi:SAM-dependent MidA family methyltransferase
VTPLAARLAAEIASDGPLRFDRTMARALFDPEHGYYASARAHIGREGDFYTSVSVGRAFGRVLAEQFAEIWERLDRPKPFDLVEQGANDGRLAADVLEALRERRPDCLAALRYTLVEPFPALRERQRETLAAWGCARWISTLDALEPFTGVHFTNEYADALPVRLFVHRGGAWFERHVTAREGALAFLDLPAGELPRELPESAPEGYLAETRPEAAAWVAAVAVRLERGVMLAVDYGFPRAQLYAPWRTAGTLSCYRSHRRDDDPLESPGEKDLTAHVDFTALAEAGLSAGLELAGFADQYHFLVGAGTPWLLDLEKAAPSAQRDADLRALKSLLHPETMGTQFKYLALARDLAITPPLAGFRHAAHAAARLGLQYQPTGNA